MKKISKNVQNVLTTLKAEIQGDVKDSLKLLDKNYSMTWVYRNKRGELFPHTKADVKRELEEVYVIKGRKYDVKHIAEAKDLVILELIESYPDPKTKKVYRTPEIIVLEMKNGKIKRGRHYCDPALSYLNLTTKEIDKIFKL